MPDSIYVPSSAIKTWKKVVAVVAAIATPLSPPVVSWVSSRPSRDEMSGEIAKANIAAKAAQSDTLSASNAAEQALALATETARQSAELWGQAVVERAYNNSPRRAEYIERARNYYRDRFDAFRKSTEFRGDPAGALQRAIKESPWRPDRSD